jgi:hypothetical protein
LERSGREQINISDCTGKVECRDWWGFAEKVRDRKIPDHAAEF